MVSLMKIALVAALCIALTDASCETMKDRCKGHLRRGPSHYKEHCKKSYVAKFCPELCRGDCDGGVVTTTTTTTSDPTTDCKDISKYCTSEYYKSRCHQQYAKDYCKKTCGLCGGPTTTTTSTTRPTTTSTTTSTTTVQPGDCTDKNSRCPQWTQYCQTSDYMKINCKKTCGLCGGTTSTQKPTTTTTQEPSTTTQEPSTTTQEPATTTTEAPITTTTSPTDPPVTGGCGDKEPMCFMKSKFNAGKDCNIYGNVCIRSCNKCSGPSDNVCGNLKDRALDCGSRNCRAEKPLTMHRAHTKCARTCCERKQLY